MSPQSSHRSVKRLDLHIVDLYQLDLARIVRKFFVYAFAGVLREKIRTRVSFTKLLANYTSKESLMTTNYDKKYNLNDFSFTKVSGAGKG